MDIKADIIRLIKQRPGISIKGLWELKEQWPENFEYTTLCAYVNELLTVDKEINVLIMKCSETGAHYVCLFFKSLVIKSYCSDD